MAVHLHRMFIHQKIIFNPKTKKYKGNFEFDTCCFHATLGIGYNGLRSKYNKWQKKYYDTSI